MTHPSTDRWMDALGRAINQNDPDGALLELLDSVGRRLGEVDDLVSDSVDGPGWSALMDPDRTPYPAWTAQLVGVTIPGGTSDAGARALIKARPRARRGSIQTIKDIARLHLTGTKRVDVIERTTSAYTFTVRTYAAETPDPAAVEAALRAAKPAGLVLTYEIRSGITYDERDALFTSYDQLDAAFSSYDDLDSYTGGA